MKEEKPKHIDPPQPIFLEEILKQHKKSERNLKIILGLFIAIIILALIWFFFFRSPNIEEQTDCEFFCIFCKNYNCSSGMRVRRVLVPNTTKDDYDHYTTNDCITTIDCTLIFDNRTKGVS